MVVAISLMVKCAQSLAGLHLELYNRIYDQVSYRIQNGQLRAGGRRTRQPCMAEGRYRRCHDESSRTNMQIAFDRSTCVQNPGKRSFINWRHDMPTWPPITCAVPTVLRRTLTAEKLLCKWQRKLRTYTLRLNARRFGDTLTDRLTDSLSPRRMTAGDWYGERGERAECLGVRLFIRGDGTQFRISTTSPCAND